MFIFSGWAKACAGPIIAAKLLSFIYDEGLFNEIYLVFFAARENYQNNFIFYKYSNYCMPFWKFHEIFTFWNDFFAKTCQTPTLMGPNMNTLGSSCLLYLFNKSSQIAKFVSKIQKKNDSKIPIKYLWNFPDFFRKHSHDLGHIQLYTVVISGRCKSKLLGWNCFVCKNKKLNVEANVVGAGDDTSVDFPKIFRLVVWACVILAGCGFEWVFSAGLCG